MAYTLLFYVMAYGLYCIMLRHIHPCMCRITGPSLNFPLQGSLCVRDRFTEADLRLYPTAIRYDAVYATLFKCSRRRIADYPHISAWLRDVYQINVGNSSPMQVSSVPCTSASFGSPGVLLLSSLSPCTSASFGSTGVLILSSLSIPALVPHSWPV